MFCKTSTDPLLRSPVPRSCCFNKVTTAIGIIVAIGLVVALFTGLSAHGFLGNECANFLQGRVFPLITQVFTKTLPVWTIPTTAGSTLLLFFIPMGIYSSVSKKKNLLPQTPSEHIDHPEIPNSTESTIPPAVLESASVLSRASLVSSPNIGTIDLPVSSPTQIMPPQLDLD